jgi:Flp pilus assembly protein TadD
VNFEHLQELDRSERFADLAEALAAIDAAALVPPYWQGPLAYWRGKLALLDQRWPEALQALAEACRLQPGRPHAHYLLGAACVRSRQWCDARWALTRALALDPHHAPSRWIARVGRLFWPVRCCF